MCGVCVAVRMTRCVWAGAVGQRIRHPGGRGGRIIHMFSLAESPPVGFAIRAMENRFPVSTGFGLLDDE